MAQTPPYPPTSPTSAPPPSGAPTQPTGGTDPISAMLDELIANGDIDEETAAAIASGAAQGADPFASDISGFNVGGAAQVAHPSADTMASRIERRRANELRGPLTNEERARVEAEITREESAATSTHHPPQKLGDLLKAFYRLPEQDLLELQKHLFAGGFYGDRGITDIAWGEHGEDSFAAYAQALERAARYYGAGADIGYWDVIRMASEAGAGVRAEGVTGPNGSGTRVLGGRNVDLSDPAALRLTLDETSRAILGRRASTEEQRVFVSLLHSLQRQAAGGVEVSVDAAGMPNLDDLDQVIEDVRTGNYGTGDVGAADFTQVSPEAQAYEYAIQAAPTEYAANQVSGQATAAEDLIFNPRRLPNPGGG